MLVICQEPLHDARLTKYKIMKVVFESAEICEQATVFRYCFDLSAPLWKEAV